MLQRLYMLFVVEHATLWVPNWSSMSCDLGVFVDQPAEPIATSETKLGW